MVPEQTHLVLLPEMFNTGFVTEADAINANKEKMDGKSVQLLESIASKRNCWLMGSLLIEGEANKSITGWLLLVQKGNYITITKDICFLMGESSDT